MIFVKLLKPIPAALLSLCAATLMAQAVGVGVLWSRGALTRQKIARYAAAVYGFDLRDLSPDESRRQPAESSAAVSGQAVLPSMEKTRLLTDRLKAVKRTDDDIYDRVRELTKKRERYVFVQKSFEDLLTRLERDSDTFAIQEVQRTLETLPPRQAKDLVLAMLEQPTAGEEDDVLADVVAILKSMSEDQLKKILGEFKTENERQTLHAILAEIGQIDARQRWESNS